MTSVHKQETPQELTTGLSVVSPTLLLVLFQFLYVLIFISFFPPINTSVALSSNLLRGALDY